ncbi:MAG: hypothetical protein HC888_08215 [Candidatus Competibacteraceae bacterium]|nr:hypothetical protein [Candidatus Competibacteraceae bacterium]
MSKHCFRRPVCPSWSIDNSVGISARGLQFVGDRGARDPLQIADGIAASGRRSTHTTIREREVRIMARIRSIKPEFFENEELQDAEAANPGQYVMLVAAGLPSMCDKNGVFEWKPRTLKLHILPFLGFDIAKNPRNPRGPQTGSQVHPRFRPLRALGELQERSADHRQGGGRPLPLS